MTLEEIFMGKVDIEYKGLIQLIRELMDIKEYSNSAKIFIERYLKLVE
jgi:hypothetical protein